MKFLRAETKSCTCKDAMTQPGDGWAGADLWKKPGSCMWAGSRKGHQPHGLHQQGKGSSPSAQHSSNHSQNTAGIWAPQCNKETSPGGSNQSGRDSSSQERLHSQGLSACRRHGFGRASQDLQGGIEEMGSSQRPRVGWQGPVSVSWNERIRFHTSKTISTMGAVHQWRKLSRQVARPPAVKFSRLKPINPWTTWCDLT